MRSDGGFKSDGKVRCNSNRQKIKSLIFTDKIISEFVEDAMYEITVLPVINSVLDDIYRMKLYKDGNPEGARLEIINKIRNKYGRI